MPDHYAAPATMNRMPPAARSNFALYAFLAFFVMALYASLRPFNDWGDPGVNPFAFLGGATRSAVRRWDVILNFAGYLPLGFFATLALRPYVGATRAVLIAIVALSSFSLAVEITQNYLPMRTPSLVDVIVNVLGASVGTTLASAVGTRFEAGGGGRGLRDRWLLPGAAGELTLLLAAAWFFALLAPRTMLFGNGDARAALGLRVRFDVPSVPFDAIEAATTTLSVLAIALIVRALMRPEAPQRAVFISLLIAGALTRAMGFALFWSVPFAFAWVTRGALVGVAIGVVLGLLALRVRSEVARPLAVAALAAAVTIINVSPPDPHLWYKLRVVRGSELSALSSVTRNAAMLWPFAAIALLVLPGAPRRRPMRPTSPA